MTTAQIISSLIAFFALLISFITAYKTFFSQFTSELFLRSRIILTKINDIPVIIIGCEMSNQGSKAGSIDDIVLKIKYRCGDGKNKNINTYSFIPRLSREDYSIFKTYQESDFEPFQSIPLPAKSRLSRYIVFIPSNDGFSPSIGSMEINIFRRNFNCNEWNKSYESLNIDLDEDTVTVWKGPSGKGIIIEATENLKYREKLMESF